jgi:hypothetical protein
MEFEKMFKVVVVGGSLLAGGCAAKTASAPATAGGASTPAATENAAAPEAAPETPAATEETPAPEAEADGSKKAAAEPVNCEELCDTLTPDGESICPDPNNEGTQNCCWLMIPKHECCPS